MTVGPQDCLEAALRVELDQQAARQRLYEWMAQVEAETPEREREIREAAIAWLRRGVA
jgi:hypothetical protein